MVNTADTTPELKLGERKRPYCPKHRYYHETREAVVEARH